MAKKTAKVDLAKQLLEKAKELGDKDLLEMANALAKEPRKKPRKKAAKKAPAKKDSHIAPVFTEESKKAPKQKIDENGNVVGTYTRREPIVLKQKFYDDGITDKKDKANKILKKYTKHTPRTRQASTIDIQCSGECNKTYTVSTVHVHNGKYVCDRCIMRKGRGDVV